MHIITVIALTLTAAVSAQQSSYNSCGGALPANIRVEALPDSYLVAGNPNSGFFVDLLNAIQGVTGIPYTLTARSDLNYGNQNADGSFNGSLIGELVANSADLVGADLTITSAREAVVDFLVPLSQYSLQILVNTQFGLGAGVQYLSLSDADLTYLQNSKNANNQAIAANIIAGMPGSIVASDAAGVAKVLSGNFAYIIESPAATQALANAANAGKIQVQGKSLGTFYLALAVQQGSPLREKLNIAMLQLAEQGVLLNLLNKYNLTG